MFHVFSQIQRTVIVTIKQQRRIRIIKLYIDGIMVKDNFANPIVLEDIVLKPSSFGN